MCNIIAGVSFLVFSHYLANIVYRDIKAISPDFCDHNYLLWNTLCLCPLEAPDAHIYGRPCDLESRGNLLIILRLLIGYLVFIQRIHYKYSILPIPPRTIFQVFLEPFFSWNFPQLIFSDRKFCKLGYFISSLISSTCDVSKHRQYLLSAGLNIPYIFLQLQWPLLQHKNLVRITNKSLPILLPIAHQSWLVTLRSHNPIMLPDANLDAAKSFFLMF